MKSKPIPRWFPTPFGVAALLFLIGVCGHFLTGCKTAPVPAPAVVEVAPVSLDGPLPGYSHATAGQIMDAARIGIPSWFSPAERRTAEWLR